MIRKHTLLFSLLIGLCLQPTFSFGMEQEQPKQGGFWKAVLYICSFGCCRPQGNEEWSEKDPSLGVLKSIPNEVMKQILEYFFDGNVKGLEKLRCVNKEFQSFVEAFLEKGDKEKGDKSKRAFVVLLSDDFFKNKVCCEWGIKVLNAIKDKFFNEGCIVKVKPHFMNKDCSSELKIRSELEKIIGLLEKLSAATLEEGKIQINEKMVLPKRRGRRPGPFKGIGEMVDTVESTGRFLETCCMATVGSCMCIGFVILPCGIVAGSILFSAGKVLGVLFSKKALLYVVANCVVTGVSCAAWKTIHDEYEEYERGRKASLNEEIKLLKDEILKIVEAQEQKSIREDISTRCLRKVLENPLVQATAIGVGEGLFGRFFRGGRRRR